MPYHSNPDLGGFTTHAIELFTSQILIFTGLRIALGLTWLAIITAKIVLSGIVGIGFFIWDAYYQNYVSKILLAALYIGVGGLLLDLA